MNLKGLNAFSAIMTHGSMSTAAEKLHISVPAMSRQLSMLEDEIGLKLFHRTKQRLVPTEHGKAFYAESSRLLRSIEQMPDVIEEIKRGVKSRLRAVLMPRLSEGIGMPAINEFMRECPDINMIIDLEVWRSIEIKIASRQFDIGLGGLPALHSALETEHLGRIPLVAVVHPAHPLAERECLSAIDLATEPLILMPVTTWVGRQSVKVFMDSGVEPNIRVQLSQVHSCCYLVAEGGGVAIVDQLTAKMVGPRVKAVHLDTELGVDIGLIFPRGVERSAETQRLAEIMREHSKGALELTST